MKNSKVAFVTDGREVIFLTPNQVVSSSRADPFFFFFYLFCFVLFGSPEHGTVPLLNKIISVALVDTSIKDSKPTTG